MQVTLSLVLLTGAALLVGTLVHLETLDPGFDREHVLLVDAELGGGELDAEQRRPLVLGLLEELRALPGVRAAGFTEMTPVSGNSVTEFVVAAGYRSLLEEDIEVHVHRVGDGYFASLGVPLLRGRDIADTDRSESEPVAVISESMARRMFGGLDDVTGKHFHRRLNDVEVSEPIRVVGVVPDAKPGAAIPKCRVHRGRPMDRRPNATVFRNRTSSTARCATRASRRRTSRCDNSPGSGATRRPTSYWRRERPRRWRR